MVKIPIGPPAVPTKREYLITALVVLVVVIFALWVDWYFPS